MVWPVTQPESGPSRYAMAAAMSAGSPSLPSGCRSREAFLAVSLRVTFSVMGVCTRPGETTLKRSPLDTYEAAAESASPETPAFAAATASWLASPTRAATEESSTTDRGSVRSCRRCSYAIFPLVG